MKEKREDAIMKKLDDVASKVDQLRAVDLPQIKMDVQQGISEVKLHVAEALTTVKVDVGGLKVKAAAAGAASGIVATGFLTFILSKWHGH